MRQILWIGIGGVGSTSAEMFSQKMKDDGIFFRSVAFDTDESALAKLNMSTPVSLVDDGGLGDVVEALGPEKLMETFPSDWERDSSGFVRSLSMKRGANGWRMKALLSFYSYIGSKERTAELRALLDEFTEDVEIYVSASLAGGTGAGLLLPITLYVKNYIQSIGGHLVKTSAALALPAIFAGALSSEQVIKSNANAYAALRELHAVNTVLLSSEEERKRSFFSYKIGFDGKPGGVIFDIQNKKFADPAYAPFDEVYLFERIPGVTSVSTHIDIITETAAAFLRTRVPETEHKNLETTAIFGGASLTKVRYPEESIIKYMVKSRLHTLLETEMGSIGRAVDREIARAVMDRKSCGKLLGDTLPLYCHRYAELAASAMDSCEIAEPLLRRDYEKTAAADVRSFTPARVYVGRIRDAVAASLVCEERQAIAELLEELGRSKADLKKEKINPKEHLREGVPALLDGITCYFRFGIEAMKENETFAKSLFSENAAFSIERDVLSENGEHLHPAYALYKLSELYAALEKLIAERETVEELPADAAALPKSLLILKRSKAKGGKYAAAAEDRLSLAFHRESAIAEERLEAYCERSVKDRDTLKAMTVSLASAQKQEKIVDGALYSAKELFFEDVLFAVNRLADTLLVERTRAVLSYLATFIERYRQIFTALCAAADDVAADVKMWRLANSGDSGNLVHVGATVSEKEALLSDYTAEYLKTSAAPHADDAAVGKCIAAHVFGGDDREAGVASLMDCLGGVYETSLLATDFYKTRIHRNIFEVIYGALDATYGIANASSSKIFAGRSLPLSLGLPETAEERYALSSVTAAILPLSLRDAVAEKASAAIGGSPEALIKRLMYNAGEYEGDAFFSAGIPDCEMYVSKTMRHMPLYMLDSLNDTDKTYIGYQSYKKARALAKSQLTPMWDPDLFYRRDGATYLPYISPIAERTYEDALAKALIYAFMKNILSLSEWEGDTVYFRMDESGNHPILLDGKTPIIQKQVSELVRTVYGDPAWVRAHSKAFEKEMKAFRTKFPAFRERMMGYGLVIHRITGSELYTAFVNATARLIKLFYDAKAFDLDGYAGSIARHAARFIEDFCRDEETAFNGVSSGIYNRMINTFNAALSAASSAKTAQKLLDMLGERGLFLRHSCDTGFLPNVISEMKKAAVLDDANQELRETHEEEII